MTRISVKETLFPLLFRNINPNLLSIKTPKFQDDEEDIWGIWKYIEKKMWKKLNKCPGEKIKCEQIKKEFMGIYGRIKKKKEDGEAKENNRTERMFYRLHCPIRSHNDVLERIGHRAKKYRPIRGNDEI